MRMMIAGHCYECVNVHCKYAKLLYVREWRQVVVNQAKSNLGCVLPSVEIHCFVNNTTSHFHLSVNFNYVKID